MKALPSALSSETCDRLRLLIRPGYAFFLQNSQPDAGDDSISRAIETAFDPTACSMLLLAACRLREMILIAGCGLNIPATEELVLWLQQHIGQIAFYPERWAYRGVRVIGKPKRIDSHNGQIDFDFGAPQIVALFIYWIFRSFDSTSSVSDASNGEYYLGVCPGCHKVFEKNNIQKSHCGSRSCRTKWDRLKPVEAAVDQ